MPAEHVVNVDLARVWSAGEKKRLLRTLSWGDPVEVVAGALHRRGARMSCPFWCRTTATILPVASRSKVRLASTTS
jgi:hypothetical protein